MTKPKNPNKDTLFPRSVALMWVKMFMLCYRRGVNDAAQSADEGLCREYLEQTSQTCVWGELNDRRLSTDPIDWQVTLNAVGRDARMFQPLQRYFFNMGRYCSNYFSPAMVIALDWYRRGVSDYISSPASCSVTDFNMREKALWGRKGIENVDNGRIVDITQGMIRDRSITDSESGHKFAIRERHYAEFRRRIANASQTKMLSYYG